MPRFFTHIRDADELIEDIEGQDYPDLAKALAEAEKAVREMLAEKIRFGDEVDGQRIEIVDESGALMASFFFRDMIRYHHGQSPTAQRSD